MPGFCAFFYSSVDRPEIRAIHAYALSEAQQIGMQPWLDEPIPRPTPAQTLHARSPIEEQIQQVIQEAEAIVYILGWTGLGPYQANFEARWLREELERRQQSGRPLRFVPVMLRRANPDDLPDWMRAYSIVNLDLLLSQPLDLWLAIRQRLLAGAEPLRPPRPDELRPRQLDAVASLVQEITGSADQPHLTLFIGPYAVPRPGRNAVGPMELSRTLLESIGISRDQLEPLPPWPSEAAQWARVGVPEAHTEALIQRKLARNSLCPRELEHGIAELAKMWSARMPRSRFGYNGLVLLTTRIDVGLELALVQQPNMEFTRFVPTAWGSSMIGWENYVVQKWRSKDGWKPNPPSWVDPAPPWEPVQSSAKKGLQNVSLERFCKVVLIKLCGTLDLPDTLMLTTEDFFAKADHLADIPSQLQRSVNTSPQVLLGCGFASPLAQLVRLKLLGTRPGPDTRILVMPYDLSDANDRPHGPPDDSLDAGFEPDFLNTLETRLVREKEDIFKRAFGLSGLYRDEPHNFILRLTAALALAYPP